MESINYLVMGATGNIGNLVATNLVAQGKAVKVIGRNAEKLLALKELGAEVLAGDITDSSFLKQAFLGVDAAFLMIPPFYDAEDHFEVQRKVANLIGDAVEQSQLKAVVNLSSSGVEQANQYRLLAGVEQLENRLNALEDLNVLHLRPAYFLDNFLANLPLVGQGIFGSMVKEDVAFPAIATQDIGEYAAKRLLALDFEGKNQIELHGPEAITPSNLNQAVSEALGKPLNYIQFSYEDAQKAMVDSGMFKESAAQSLAELCRALNEGQLYSSETESVSLKTGIKDFFSNF